MQSGSTRTTPTHATAGAAVNELRQCGFIALQDYRRSERPCRHRAPVNVWRVLDAFKATREADRIDDWLQDHPQPIESELFDSTNKKTRC